MTPPILRTSNCEFYDDCYSHAIKAAKRSLSTLFASYQRVSTFVYCRMIIHISNSFVLLFWCSLINSFLPSKFFCSGYFSSSFSLHTPRGFQFSKKWKWDCAIAFLCLITCSWNLTNWTCCSYLLINILQAIWFSGNNH